MCCLWWVIMPSYDGSNTIHWYQLQDQIIKIKINLWNIWQFIMGFTFSLLSEWVCCREWESQTLTPQNIMPVGNAKGPMYAKTTLPIILEWCPFSLSLSLFDTRNRRAIAHMMDTKSLSGGGSLVGETWKAQEWWRRKSWEFWTSSNLRIGREVYLFVYKDTLAKYSLNILNVSQ